MNPSILITPNAVKAGKLYSIIPTDGAGDLNVVRATSATRVNENGLIETVGNDIARLDYSNGSCPSILVEPQRTNIILQNSKFDLSPWDSYNISLTPNSTISPDGALNAYLYQGNGLSNVKQLFQIGTLTSSTTYTLSFFAKKGTNNFIQLLASSTTFISGFYANFDLQNGVIGSYANTASIPIIEDYGNGWYRCSVSVTSQASPANNVIFSLSFISSLTAGRGETNSLSTSVYIWGAQLEAGANATSYIPTVASTVTRNADVIVTTGISDLIGQTEGTIFLEFEKTRQSSEIKSLFILRGANILNDSISIQTPNNNQNINLSIIVNGVVYSMPLGSRFLLEGLNKIALIYSTNGSKFFLNGVLEATYTNTALPTMIDLDLGNRISSRQWSAGIYQCSLWKTQLTDEQCINLTTL